MYKSADEKRDFMQILIVEDEKRLANALKQILLEQKYMADVVHDGNEGLEYALSGIYDLIILDIMLPYKDGFQVAFELREKKISTPILMLTAKDTITPQGRGNARRNRIRRFYIQFVNEYALKGHEIGSPQFQRG